MRGPEFDILHGGRKKQNQKNQYGSCQLIRLSRKVNGKLSNPLKETSHNEEQKNIGEKYT